MRKSLIYVPGVPGQQAAPGRILGKIDISAQNTPFLATPPTRAHA
jgi:hypothetical protein